MANSISRIAVLTWLVLISIGLSIAGTPVHALSSVDDEESAAIALRSATVVAIEGRASKKDSELSPLVVGTKLSIGDRVETGLGRAKLLFPDGSELTLMSDSVLRLVEIKTHLPANGETLRYRNIVVELVKGDARVRVLPQTDDSNFELQTRTSIIGWQKGESIVSFKLSEAPWRTEVSTLSGSAVLEADGREDSDKARITDVAAGVVTAYVVEAQAPGAIPYEVEAAIHRGFMSPPKRLSGNELANLDRATAWGAKLSDGKSTGQQKSASKTPSLKSASKAPDAVCRAPAGGFNQCSWTCEGNPKGSKACRTELRGVQCVRRLCRANGQWAEATVLPAGHARECGSGSVPVTGSCGNYW